MTLKIRDMHGAPRGRPIVPGEAATQMPPHPRWRTGPGAHGWQRRLLGAGLGWPWLDPVTLAALRYGFFPLSRLWAAALVAEGRPDRFFDAVGLPRRPEAESETGRVLARFEEVRARADAIDKLWDEAFFGLAETTEARRVALEAARLDARHALNGARRLFWRFLVHPVPRIALATETPAATAERYGHLLETGLGPASVPPTPLPNVEVSRAIPGTVGRDYWIRFAAPGPAPAGLVLARVHEPTGVEDAPTIILGHGICVEFDHWRGLVDETDELVRRGFRVIRPEAPWHGRRAAAGAFGAEPILARFPTGSIDAFLSAVREWAVIASWVRTISTAPLAFGGTSMGAQTAQLAAHHARAHWPEAIRPDALLLITHCASIGEAVMTGALPTIFGSTDDVAAKGWTPENVAPYLSLLDPGPSPPIEPARIVSVLGRYDTITPFESGARLVRDWGVPEENRFVLDRGHFSVPMTLIRKPAALDRFAAIVRGLPRR